MDCNKMEFENCGDCDEAELWGLIKHHQEKAKQNSDAVNWCIANVQGFAYSNITTVGLLSISAFHLNTARYLTNFTRLIKAVKDGYAIFIKCPVCKSCTVDLDIKDGFITHLCVNCNNKWDFSLDTDLQTEGG